MIGKELKELLAGSEELALLDVREQGVHYRGHPFFACSAPLSRLELMIVDLVPRRGARVVLLDGQGEGLAEKASTRLKAMSLRSYSMSTSRPRTASREICCPFFTVSSIRR